MLIGGLASAGGSVASGIMGGNAAQKAAAVQEQAAQKAAQYQQQNSQQALTNQQNEWNTTQSEMQPFLQSGIGATSNLDYLMGITPQGGISAPGNATSTFGSPSAQSTQSGSPAAGTSITPQSPFANGPRPIPLTSGPTPNVKISMNGVPTGGQPGVTPLTNPGMPASNFSATPPPGSSPGGFGSLMQGYDKTFQAPTAQDMEQNDPGYQARMNLGQQAMEQSAAARGGLLTGGTAQAENQLAQDYASNEYNNYYNQAFNTFGSNYNQYEQNQANQFNRLAALSGMGQQTASQLGSLGQSAANGVTNNLLSTGQMVGNDYTNAGNANASGIVGSANAYGGMAQGLGNSISGMMNLSMLQNMLGGGGDSGAMPYSWLNGTADPLNLGGAS